MKKKMLALLLLGASSVFGANVFIGVGVGGPRGYIGAPRGYLLGPPPAPIVGYARPPIPGPGYVWIPGYYTMVGRAYRWRAGYWAIPPRARARWVAPRYNRGRYYNGYWR